MALDNGIDIFVEAHNFQGGQYKKMGEKKLDKFCDTLYTDTFKEPFNDFYVASTAKIPFGTCPFPAGDNELTNLMFSDNGFLPPYIPGGEKWKIDIGFRQKGVVLGGVNIYAILRNERTLLKGL